MAVAIPLLARRILVAVHAEAAAAVMGIDHSAVAVVVGGGGFVVVDE